MSRRIKQILEQSLRTEWDGLQDVLVVSVVGMDAITNGRLRAKLNEKKIHLRVVKNTLAARALRGVGLESAAGQLQGPAALVWGGENIVELAKEVTKWAKDIEPLKIKGGATEGRGLTPQDVGSLSLLPSREELLGGIVSKLLGPGGRLVGMLLGPGGRLAGQIKTRAERAEEETAVGEETATAPTEGAEQA